MRKEIDSALEILFAIAPETRIIHHVPGRIRIRVNEKAGKYLDNSLGNNKKIFSSIPGIENIRINPLIGSILIEYDLDFLEPSLWETIIGNRLEDQDIARLKKELLEKINIT